jgi:hypothetical protein
MYGNGNKQSLPVIGKKRPVTKLLVKPHPVSLSKGEGNTKFFWRE